MEGKKDLRWLIHVFGLLLFWGVWLYGLIGMAVVTRFPEVLRDGVYIVISGRSPQ